MSDVTRILQVNMPEDIYSTPRSSLRPSRELNKGSIKASIKGIIFGLIVAMLAILAIAYLLQLAIERNWFPGTAFEPLWGNSPLVSWFGLIGFLAVAPAYFAAGFVCAWYSRSSVFRDITVLVIVFMIPTLYAGNFDDTFIFEIVFLYGFYIVITYLGGIVCSRNFS